MLAKIDSSQGAYQKGKSTIDHIFTLMAITQNYLSRAGGRLYCVFIDFSKCFDSVQHLHLYLTDLSMKAFVAGF